MHRTFQDFQRSQQHARKVKPCPTCGKVHAAYALFAPACQHPGDRHTAHVGGRPA